MRPIPKSLWFHTTVELDGDNYERSLFSGDDRIVAADAALSELFLKSTLSTKLPELDRDKN